MPELSSEGRQIAAQVAARAGVSTDTATTLLVGLAASGGSQVQFNIPELGGLGQWSRGGMVMVGDMFNNALKARVDALCSELATLATTPSLLVHGGGDWWPSDLGRPAATGAQNSSRYAFFPAARRLAIETDGRLTIHDTGGHVISGFGQQQPGPGGMSFTSQHGPVRLADLPTVGATPSPEAAVPAPVHQAPVEPVAAEHPPAVHAAAAVAPAAPAEPSTPDAKPAAAASPALARPPEARGDTIDQIERLADLHGRGILTDEEFRAKKSELLSRI